MREQPSGRVAEDNANGHAGRGSGMSWGAGSGRAGRQRGLNFSNDQEKALRNVAERNCAVVQINRVPRQRAAI
jgi:hypothetical protein